MKTEVRYYNDFSDNFVKTRNQEKTVPENYRFIKKNLIARFLGLVLFGVLKIVAFIYGKIWLGLKIEGKSKLRAYVRDTKKGYYVYANHTLALGDVFNPALYSPVHPYYVCDSSNLGIPILGPILPLVGALPIPESIRGKKRLFDAISTRAKQKKAIVIYPEAHLWPYYTEIRPFETSAFSFPVRDELPVFTAATTFKARKGHRRPRITIFIDGPFYPKTDEKDFSSERALLKAKAASLHDQAYTSLKSRAKLSTEKYIIYKKREH